MTPKQISLVRRTFAPIAAQPARAGAFFYDHLFALAPSLRSMFPKDLRRQGAIFVETLGVMIGALDRLESIETDLEKLGKRHVEYGVQPHHYELMREALLWSLAQLLAEEFDDEVAAAWCEAFSIATHAMRQAELQA